MIVAAAASWSGRIALASIAILLTGAAVLTRVQYQADLRQAMDRSASGSHLIDTPCGQIEYAMVGDGPAVLVVHGAGGGFDQGLESAQPLIDRGFTVIAPSRFGYLRTPLPQDASPEAQADAYACLLDALHVARVTAAAGSAGAPSVMQFCLRHQERCSAMILLAPMAFVPGESGKPSLLTQAAIHTTLRSDFAFWVAANLARDTMIETILATPIADFERASAPEQERVLTIFRSIQPVSRRARGLQNDAAVAGTLPRYDLERIATPTLIITARNDLFGTLESSRYTAVHIPGARLIVYGDGGHVGVGHAEETWSAAIEFLENSRHERSREAPGPQAGAGG